MDGPQRQHLMTVAGLCFVLLPLFASFWYSQATSWGWLLRAGLAAAIFLYLLTWLHDLPGRSWWRLGLVLVLGEGLALFLVLRLVSFFFQGESFNARFLFHLSPDSLTDAGSYPVLIAGVLAYLVLLPLGLWVYLQYRHQTRAPVRHALGAALVFLITEPDIAGFMQQGFMASQEWRTTVAELELQGTGLHLEALEARLDGVSAGRNLVLVYMESLERIYTEDDIFPGLTPFLSSIKTNSLYFSDLRSSAGATWTVAGMMASQCGTPLLAGIGPRGNDMLQNGFLHNAVCLGDLLKSAGYRQAFVGGASTRFAGKATFLRQHGYDEVLGLNELLPELPDPAYLNNWGLYDDSMFEFALKKFHALAASDKSPFNLTVLTVDTHHPTGTPSASCPRYPAIDNSILHAVHCSDWLLQRFVTALQQHPAWENTVLVLMSDHLAMRNVAQNLYPDDYERELYLAVLNTPERRQLELPASHMDIAPTLLSLLQVGHQQQFLAGDNLLDPASAMRAVDFDSPSRLAAIRLINSELLTRRERNVCTHSGPALEIRNGLVYLAGKEVYLGLGGRSVPVDYLAATHALVVLLEEDGSVQSTLLVNGHSLPHFLHQTAEWRYLVLTSADMASWILPDEPLAPGMVVLAGSARSGNQSLLQGADLRGLSLELDCAQLPREAGKDIGAAAPAAALANLCPVLPEMPPVVFDEERDRIDAARVAVVNQWYSASLQGDGAGNYRIVAQHLLGSIDDMPANDYCHAYFVGSKVLIPYARSGERVLSLQLEQVPGTTGQFRLVDLYRM